MNANYAPSPNRRQRFPLAARRQFPYLFSAPPAASAAVGEARLLVFVLVSFVSGCSSADHSTGRTHTLVVQDITLNRAKPTVKLGQYSIRLLSIADDGTTQIRVAQTDKVLSARPGQCFVSYEFGQEGLELVSASKSSGTATMISRGCISH
jgi:hypothetical protein